MPVLVVGLRTVVGAIIGAAGVGVATAGSGTLHGAAAGAAGGFIAGVISEAKGELVNQVAGEYVGQAVQWLAEEGAPGLQTLDPTVGQEEAELLIKLGILALSTGKDFADGLKSLGKSLKPRHAMAGVGDIDLDDYSGTTGNIDDIALFAKQYPEGVNKVGGRYPINGDFAGKIFHFADPELAKLYPNGVEFSPEGFPIFTPYAIHRVEIEYTGNRRSDKIAANAAAGLKNEPDGYTWHHHHDTKTMELIPKRLHETLSHTGGFAANKHKR